jgi:uncharacterized ion transporter superfamily protein YfcC
MNNSVVMMMTMKMSLKVTGCYHIHIVIMIKQMYEWILPVHLVYVADPCGCVDSCALE